MKRNRNSLLVLLCSLALASTAVFAQGAPQIVWEVPTPSSLANSVQGVGWAPGTVARIAVGSTDRWVRTRRASSGALVYSVLQPHRSGGADQTVYSTDGVFLPRVARKRWRFPRHAQCHDRAQRHRPLRT
jgi:hypothetical protein